MKNTERIGCISPPPAADSAPGPGKPEKGANKLIGSKSTGADRETWLRHLGKLAAAMPAEPILGAIQAELQLALEAGVDWRELYRDAVSLRRPYWPPAPSEEEVDPER